MDRSERHENPHIAMLALLSGERADIWTSLPGIIDSFDPVAMTAEVQPAIQAQFTSPVDGSKKWVTLPLCVDCPVQFPSGGGVTLTFPVAKGDECVIQFSSRCIDAWWQQGGVQPQATLRMHDLSDGFVIPGIRSQPRVLSNVSTTEAQLRTDDGAAFVALNPSTHLIRAVTTGAASVTATGEIDLTSSAKIKLTAPLVEIDTTTLTINGDTVLNGGISQGSGGSGTAAHLIGPVTVDNELTANGHTVSNHHHSDPQGGNVGTPIG